MKISSVKKHGKIVYRVYAGNDLKNKRIYKQFKTEEDAATWIKDELVRRKAHGRLTAGLDGALVSGWNKIDKQLREYQTNLLKIGEEALQRLQCVKMEGTPTACLEKFVEFKIKQGRRPAYTSDLKSRCLRFIETLPPDLPAKSIMPEHIQAHLNDLPGEMTQRDNQYRNLGAWLRWATHHGWIGSDPMPRKVRGKAAKITKGEAVILSPDKARSLLEATILSNENKTVPCGLDVMPFVALSLFAGIRPAEFRKRVYDKKGKPKVLNLDWSDITPEGIRISAELSKTGLARVIPLHETLKRWIEFHFLWRKTNTGPVLPSRWRETWDGWRKKYWVDQQGEEIKWNADQLRHSFGSYRLAIVKNAGQVALEMGNSPDIVLKHYWRWNTLEDEAEEFWGLHPVAALGPKHSKKLKDQKTTGGFFDR